jgi:hypothetical protein
VPVNRKTLAITLVLALLFSAVAGTMLVNLAVANFLPPPPRLPYVYIRADGTVEPTGLPIRQVGNVYNFTNDIPNYSIWVERDNIIIDGQGFTLQGNRSNGIVAYGVYLDYRNNITVRNLKIRLFEVEVWNSQSNSGGYFGVNITKNRISDCDQGGTFVAGTNNSVIGNNITNNY